MAKNKTHDLVVRIRMDRSCTRETAIRGVKECIHGEFYPTVFDWENDPQEFKVKSVKSLPRTRKGRA